MVTPRWFTVAGTHSGCGKTSVTLGVLAALRRRGWRVQPFKAGPDFIDPALHALAAGRTSHNLDAWMCPPDAVRELARSHSRGADVCVVEGVMGLHDGASAASDAGSTAQLAALLDSPVALVVDARSLARSVAALVQGYTRFDPALPVAGVICNRVASPNHAGLLRDALAAHCPGVPLLGMLPRNEAVALPSRHLGLSLEGALDAARLEALADWVEGGVDLEALLARATHHAALPNESSPSLSDNAPRVRLAVARDEAFCFCYQDTLDRLTQAGAELVFFSPLRDAALPQGIRGLYLPGGYPELHAAALEANASLRRAIKEFGEFGGMVYAECGGFMYLLDALESADGASRRAMCGVLPGVARMGTRRSALGYREIVLTEDCPLGPAGAVARGHEFHYSFLTDESPLASVARQVYHASDRTGTGLPAPGWRRGAVLASYVHLHFASNPALAGSLVQACRTFEPPSAPHALPSPTP